MIGARLAGLRDWNDQTQGDLAKLLSVSPSTIRSWEYEKSSPSHEMLIAICKLYGTSADYLLGLSDVDPSATKNICCGNAKNKPPSGTVRSLGGLSYLLI